MSPRHAEDDMSPLMKAALFGLGALVMFLGGLIALARIAGWAL